MHDWGACRSFTEAETLLTARTKDKEWADRHHERWWIEEIDTTGLFEIPSAPPPRERFSIKTRKVEIRPGAWNTLQVDVLDDAGRVITTYDRNYPTLYRTFEPFRQGDRILALISTDYTATSVMDLTTGQIIASEKPNASGFCPVGFYVPDWWDIHDESILPGSSSWSADCEHPKGDFGFVWGCIWGDDSSWKVQYLDLSRVQEGVIKRDDRFGYVELASHPELDAKEFIECSFYGGKPEVTFSVLSTFDLASGARLKSEFEID
jgi:hypothetical protein